MDNLDTFFNQGLPEIRSVGDQRVIFGYYATFNSLSHEMRTSKGIKYREVILPGAFDRTDFSSVEMRFNHEQYIAAPPAVEYGVDAVGAWYSLTIDPEDIEHRTLLRRIERREIKGSSFKFYTPSKNDQDVLPTDYGFERRIKHFPDVLDFGPVVTPAYSSTTVTAFSRNLDFQVDSGLEAEIEKLEAKKRLYLMYP